jgi:hypothetical protein
MNRHLLHTSLVLAALGILATPGCAPATPSPAPSPTPAPTATASPTVAPTATHEPTATPTPVPVVAATLTVTSTVWGVSTAYIGATEGSAGFDVDDMLDLGINTYRVWGGTSRWEWEDDDGVYGSPTIDEIKADPDAINWEWWDAAMTDPPHGSDYWWSALPPAVWEGNARTILQTLQDAGIRPVVTVRNVDNHDNPEWAQAMNPPATEEDWNEWWEHVFATVYWFNVRNDYRVDDWEIHNEPDNESQGWGGDIDDYYEFARVTYDAVATVYETYLPRRRFHVLAPVTVGGSGWPWYMLLDAPDAFNAVDIHAYDADNSPYVRRVNRWMEQEGAADWPLWVSEWGSYYQHAYGRADMGVTNVIANLIRGSRPGADHIYGSHIFSLYDWGEHEVGLIHPGTGPRASYYAFRMAARALQGARDTFEVAGGSRDLLAIATRDDEGAVYLLVDNLGTTAFAVDADLSALAVEGEVTAWRFDLSHADEMVEPPSLEDGHVRFEVPLVGAVLIKVELVTGEQELVTGEQDNRVHMVYSSRRTASSDRPTTRCG